MPGTSPKQASETDEQTDTTQLTVTQPKPSEIG